MSTLKDFSSSITQPLPGELITGLVNQGTPDGFLPVDGAVYAQATYPDLYNAVKLIANGNIFATWSTATTGGAGSDLNAIIYGDKFIAAGTNSRIFYSTTGATWTQATVSPAFLGNYDLTALAYNGSSTYLAAGGNSQGYATSTDGITWSAYTTAGPLTANALTYGGGIFVAGGNNGSLATSTNGITWTTRTTGTTKNILGLAYGNGVYIMVGQDGMLQSSTDAITWTARTSGTADFLYAVTYGGGNFVAVGDNGTVITSTDAVTWSARNAGVSARLLAVTYMTTTLANTNFYVVGGLAGVISVSRDLVTWDVASTTSTIEGLASNNSTTSLLVYGVGAGNGLTYASPFTYNPSTSFAVPTSNVTLTGLDLFIKT
jgi:hypothetical protein